MSAWEQPEAQRTGRLGEGAVAGFPELAARRPVGRLQVVETGPHHHAGVVEGDEASRRERGIARRRPRERRDAHDEGQLGACVGRLGAPQQLVDRGRLPTASALTQRARLALPGDSRSTQPPSTRCGGGAEALRPASSMRASSAWSKPRAGATVPAGGRSAGARTIIAPPFSASSRCARPSRARTRRTPARPWTAGRTRRPAGRSSAPRRGARCAGSRRRTPCRRNAP